MSGDLRHGYRGLTIGAVAREAGTTRPSVYLRFADKHDLATRATAGMAVGTRCAPRRTSGPTSCPSYGTSARR